MTPDPLTAPGWGLDGESLHDPRTGIPPDKWCVTRSDLRYLRREIRRAIREGKIQPIPYDASTGRGDPFDMEDDTVGPSMYNVVDNYIKPLTLAAGKMSWALMRHPSGLKCDIFITHCWSEGAFELIDKVLASWPAGKKHAWCCILANPQNLDINSFVQEPRESPFARALDSASHVMVVSNQACSIYTRIWCAYEAYLAYIRGKIIFTAHAPIMQRGQKACVRMLACSCFGSFGGIGVAYFTDLHVHWVVSTFVAIILIVVSQCLTRRYLAGTCIDAFGMVLMPFSIALHILDGMVDGTKEGSMRGILALTSMTVFAIYFIAAEVDRLCTASIFAEARDLGAEYITIAEARATSAEDKRRILSDIGDESEAVDASIRVLLAAGMSTPGLRKAAARGVDVKSAADLRLAIAWVGLGMWLLSNLWLYLYVCPGTSGMLHMFIANWALIALCILLWIRAKRDGQAFIGSVLTKLAVVPAFLGPIGKHYGSCFVHMCCLTIMGILAVACSAAGMGGIAQVPCVGPFLAGVLGPGCRCRRRAKTALWEVEDGKEDCGHEESTGS